MTVATQQQSYPLLRLVRRLWGNEDYTASIEFVARMIDEVHALPEGHAVVECGSGLTTAIGLLHISDPVLWYAYENDENHLANLLTRISVPHVQRPNVCLTTLEDGGDNFDWYQLGPTLDDAPPIGLVVCDGPRGDTRGGRYGAMPMLWDHLADDYVILLDDAHRDAEKKVLSEWAVDYGAISCTHECEDGRAFATIRGTK